MYNYILNNLKKPNNSNNIIHYNRYIEFIESRSKRILDENIYVEKHHIVPKSFGGKDDDSNLIFLSTREHFIAHLILWKTYNKKMAIAFWFFGQKNPHRKEVYFKINSRQYNALREEAILTTAAFNRKAIFISKDQKSKRVLPERLNFYLNEGWVLGRLNIRGNSNLGKHAKNSFWIHKNYSNKMIHIGEWNYYKSKSWIKGRNQKYSVEYRKKLATAKGKKQINNGKIRKYCNEKDLNDYLDKGWKKGWKLNENN